MVQDRFNMIPSAAGSSATDSGQMNGSSGRKCGFGKLLKARLNRTVADWPGIIGAFQSTLSNHIRHGKILGDRNYLDFSQNKIVTGPVPIPICFLRSFPFCRYVKDKTASPGTQIVADVGNNDVPGSFGGCSVTGKVDNSVFHQIISYPLF